MLTFIKNTDSFVAGGKLVIRLDQCSTYISQYSLYYGLLDSPPTNSADFDNYVSAGNCENGNTITNYVDIVQKETPKYFAVYMFYIGNKNRFVMESIPIEVGYNPPSKSISSR